MVHSHVSSQLYVISFNELRTAILFAKWCCHLRILIMNSFVVSLFTCGFQDAGLGTVGSLLIFFLQTSLERPIGSKWAPQKVVERGCWPWQSHWWGQSWPPRPNGGQNSLEEFAWKNPDVLNLLTTNQNLPKKSGCSSVNKFSSNNETKWVQVSNISRKIPPSISAAGSLGPDLAFL